MIDKINFFIHLFYLSYKEKYAYIIFNKNKVSINVVNIYKHLNYSNLDVILFSKKRENIKITPYKLIYLSKEKNKIDLYSY